MTTTNDDIFSSLREISKLTRSPERDDEARDRLIRFLDTYSYSTPELPIVDSLCAHFGLYPYMSENLQSLSSAEALALEYHAPEELAEERFVFHSMQQEIYQRLLDGESLILSAPTSFGKSVIVDALVASERWANLVLIVPTIALIDETRRRLARFRSTYDLITHPSQAWGDRNIFVMTQERFLELEQMPPVEFFMIDEFYKLGAGGKNDNRRTLLNLAWTSLSSTGAQYYLIGPNIDSLDERLPADLQERLLTTTFRTVAVDVEDRSAIADQLTDLLDLVPRLEGSTLVFTGAPARAEELGVAMARTAPAVAHGFAALVSEWIAANYDPRWPIVEALRGGVAVHTGPLPRGLQRIMVRLFNEGLVSRMVCTSTLIEGVNTAARNVVIFEKKIDGQLIDFFTFSNIQGRAGRMFRHFVGHVISYMEPPEPKDTSVDIPIETQSKKASDAALIQLPFESLDDEARERVGHIFEQTDLSLDAIRRNKGLDPTLQAELARDLRSRPRSELEFLSWDGPPTAEESRRTLKLGFDSLLEPYQRRGMNFNMLWGQLQNVRANGSSFRALVDQQMNYRRAGQTTSDVIADVLRFQRNWMGFTIPSMLRGVATIQSEILPQVGLPAGNYELFLREVEALFQPPGLVDLEEYGLPLPMAQKLLTIGLAGGDVPTLLESLIALGSDARRLERLDTVEQWILDDVLEGLAANTRGPGARIRPRPFRA